MDNNGHNDSNHSISIIEILWRFVEGWKAVICFSFIVMVLFLGYMHWREDSQSAAIIKEQQNKTESQESIISELPKKEQDAVINAFEMRQQVLSTEEYIRESPLMKMNPYQVRRFKTDWIIVGSSGQESLLTEAYVMHLKSDSFCERLLPFFGNDTDVNQIKEAILVDSEREEMNGAFSCGILLCNNEIDEEGVQKELISTINEAHEEFANKIGEHQILCINREIDNSEDQRLAEYQKTVYERLSYIDNELKTTINAFSDDQRAVYDRVTSDNNEIRNDTQIAQKISLRNGLIGLLMGVILAGGCLVLFLFFSGKVFCCDDIENMHLYTLGQWYENQPRKGMASILADHSVYRRHHQNYLNKDVALKQTAQAILNACGQAEKQLVFVVTSPLSTKQESFCDEISTVLKTNKATVRMVCVDDNHHIFDEISTSETDGVVIIAVDGKTRFKQVDKTIEQCSYYNVPIYGHIYLG